MYEFNSNSDPILSVEELMDLLKIGKNTACQLLNKGEIMAFRIGRTWKIPRNSLEDFILNSAKRSYQYLSE